MSVFKKKSMLPGVLVSVGMQLLILIMLLALCAWLMQLELLEEKNMNAHIILCVFLSVFAVCTTTSGARGRGYLLFCLSCAGGMGVFLMLTAASVKGLEPYGAWTLRFFGAAISAALSAAFIQIRHNAQRKKRRKRK